MVPEEKTACGIAKKLFTNLRRYFVSQRTTRKLVNVILLSQKCRKSRKGTRSCKTSYKEQIFFSGKKNTEWNRNRGKKPRIIREGRETLHEIGMFGLGE